MAPVYSDLICETPQIGKITGMNEVFKLAFEDQGNMEGHVAQMWNTLYPDLLLVYDKLKQLGFVFIDGQVQYLEEAGHV